MYVPWKCHIFNIWTEALRKSKGHQWWNNGLWPVCKYITAIPDQNVGIRSFKYENPICGQRPFYLGNLQLPLHALESLYKNQTKKSCSWVSISAAAGDKQEQVLCGNWTADVQFVVTRDTENSENSYLCFRFEMTAEIIIDIFFIFQIWKWLRLNLRIKWNYKC